MKPSSPRLTRQARRQQILDAFIALLNAGHDRITTAMLASHLGIGEGSLYRAFDNKAAIFDCVLTHLQQAIEQTLKTLKTDKTRCGVEQLQCMLSFFIEFGLMNPGMVRLLTGHAVVHDQSQLVERLGVIFSSMQKALEAAMRQAMLDEDIVPGFNLQATSQLMVSCVIGAWSQQALGLKPAPLRVELLLASLSGIAQDSESSKA